MKLLLANKAAVNDRGSNGWTPLHFAASEGAKGAVELLLSNGADVDAKDIDGSTPLRIAMDPERNGKKVVELLRQHGAHE
jgi:ankyrin repeat protein